MAPEQLTVETDPAAIVVEESERGRRVDCSFAIQNDRPDDLELVAVEQEVYAAGDGVVQVRLVDGAGASIPAGTARGSLIRAGERRSIRNPLPELKSGTPLAALVYRFAFRTPDGEVIESAIRLVPVLGSVPTQLVAWPLREPPGNEPRPGNERTQSSPAERTSFEPACEDEQAPTPRQLARVWFEALYRLGVYTPAVSGLG